MNKLIAARVARTVLAIYIATYLVIIEIVGIGDNRHNWEIIVAIIIYISMCGHITG